MQEQTSGSDWTTVSYVGGTTQWSAHGALPGIHQFRVEHVYAVTYGSSGAYVTSSTDEGPISVTVETPTIPAAEEQGYAVRAGDLDGDGDIDLYVKRVKGTAWTLPLPEFILRNQGGSHFAVEDSLTSSERSAIAQWTVSSIVPYLVDFNADGYKDLLLSGIHNTNAGPFDVVVFASKHRGAPPLTSVAMDYSVQRYIVDLFNYLQNPNYFQPPQYAYDCQDYGYFYSYPLYDIDGIPIYQTVWMPYHVCVRETYNPYSPEAESSAAAVGNVLQTGALIPGSSDATAIAQAFQQVFGVPLMGGVLQGGGPIDADFAIKKAIADGWGLAKSDVDAIWNHGVRAAIYSALLAQGLAQSVEYYYHVNTHGAYHRFEFTQEICTVGESNCTLDHVWRVVKELPVFGHSPDTCGEAKPLVFCKIPVPPGHLVHVQASPIASAKESSQPQHGARLVLEDGGWIGDVIVTTNEPIHTLTNSTQTNHIFYPGTITRQVYEQNGKIYIKTTGEGTGRYPKANEAFGPLIFRVINIITAVRVDKGVY